MARVREGAGQRTVDLASAGWSDPLGARRSAARIHEFDSIALEPERADNLCDRQGFDVDPEMCRRAANDAHLACAVEGHGREHVRHIVADASVRDVGDLGPRVPPGDVDASNGTDVIDRKIRIFRPGS
jgi:hypothetical protein